MKATLQLIRDYLDTLAPGDKCGITHDGRACLLHNALERAYPDHVFFVTVVDFSVDNQWPGIPHEPEVEEVVRGFDAKFSANEHSFDIVTRRQVEEAFPQLRTREPAGSPS